ncbi:MAG: HAD family phosphatase [Candidatus Pacebacteria bacterium]|nr:HAD family phosphatase [Candidatus Paceibacterota bacterium]
MNKEDIQGILFDSDGTLFRSEYRQAKAWDEILAEYNLSIQPEDYFLYAGKTSEEIEEMIAKKNNLKIEKGSLVKRKDELMLKLYGKDNLELMPCAREAVEYFHNNPRFKIALCTNGNKEEMEVKLERNGFARYFSVVITKTDVEKAKPFPDIYLKAMQELNLSPNQCLVIEDTEHGLEAAKRAGAYCFVVPHEFSNSHNFDKADKVLTSLKDLVDFFR